MKLQSEKLERTKNEGEVDDDEDGLSLRLYLCSLRSQPRRANVCLLPCCPASKSHVVGPRNPFASTSKLLFPAALDDFRASRSLIRTELKDTCI